MNPKIGITVIPQLITKFLTQLKVPLEKIAVIAEKTNSILGKLPGKSSIKKILPKTVDMTDGVRNVQKASSNVSPLLQSSRNVFKKINNTSMLVAIFGDKISEQINDGMSTDMALNIYETSVLDGEKGLENNIDALIDNNRGEVKYNFIRVKERLDDLKVVFEEEIIPIIEESFNINLQMTKQLIESEDSLRNQKDKLSELTKALINNNII